MDVLAFVLALIAEGKTAEEVKAAVDEYLEENPGAIDQAAVEAIVGEALAEQDAKLDDIEDDVGVLKSALSKVEDDLYIESSSPDKDKWEQGYWAIANGTKSWDSVWIRTKDFIDDEVVRVHNSNNLLMYLQAWQKSNDEYYGSWNGTQWSTTYTAGTGLLDISISDFRENYPGYKFKISVKAQSGNSITPAVEGNAIYFDELFSKIGDLSDLETQEKSNLVEAINEVKATHSGLPQQAAEALLNCFNNVAWINTNGKQYYYALAIALNLMSDTTAEIAEENKCLGNDGVYESVEHGGITIRYKLNTPSTILYPAGRIVVGNLTVSTHLSLAIYNDGTYVNYVSEEGRWTRPNPLSPEYKQNWNVSSYNEIAFSVDMRYLDDSYMYDYTSGQVFFAGKNTPYYGKSNVND